MQKTRAVWSTFRAGGLPESFRQNVEGFNCEILIKRMGTPERPGMLLVGAKPPNPEANHPLWCDFSSTRWAAASAKKYKSLTYLHKTTCTVN
ncbi:MAG: hypothetical protein ABFS02_05820 [Pseudomonadota bacterium]